MKIPLSNRLIACCGYVAPGDRVADIGCDHGYLGIYLLKNGIASYVIAADVNPQPLDSARQNAGKFGVSSKMDFILSDGVEKLPRDFDCMVCAGMGGDTMIHILGSAPWLKDGRYRLVLQCQSKRPLLRRWLRQEGYRIARETLAKDGKFVYSVMDVTYDPAPMTREADFYLSPQLLEDKHPLLKEYYDRVRQGVRLTVDGMRRAEDPELAAFEEILADLDALEEMIYDNCG